MAHHNANRLENCLNNENQNADADTACRKPGHTRGYYLCAKVDKFVVCANTGTRKASALAFSPTIERPSPLSLAATAAPEKSGAAFSLTPNCNLAVARSDRAHQSPLRGLQLGAALARDLLRAKGCEAALNPRALQVLRARYKRLVALGRYSEAKKIRWRLSKCVTQSKPGPLA